MPPNTVYVGRPSEFGNPFPKSLWGDEAVKKYEDYIKTAIETGALDITKLKGKNLSCWCSIDTKCHVDVLLKIANQEYHDRI